MEDPDLTLVLTGLVTLSAVPVSPQETRFAADSTGFGTTISDEQWSDAESRKAYTGSIWTKARFLVGVRTNVVTAAYVTGSLAHSGAAPQLPWLLYVTDRYFDIERILADGA